MLTHEEFRNTKRSLQLEYGTELPTNNDELTKFEKKNKIKIPKQYRGFLIKNNAIRVKYNNKYKISAKEDDYFGILGFVNIFEAEFGKNIDNFDEETGDIYPPKGLLHIAHMEDSPHTEMFICFESGTNNGKVYYCEDRQVGAEFLVADSFNEFLNGALPTYYYEWEEVCETGDIDRAIDLITKDYIIDEPEFNMVKLALESEFNMTEAIIKIIERGDDPTGMLYHASFKNNLEIVKLLIQRGCNINELPIFGEYLRKLKDTPIIGAIRGLASIELIEYLLKSGANTKLKNLEAKDALGAINTQNTRKKGHKWKDQVKELILKYNNNYG